MALPSAYLTSTKNTAAILDAITKAQAPPRFTTRFLESLGFPSSSDRLMVNVLKSVGFLNDTGEPTRRYHEYLDRSQSKTVLARGLKEAYADLFQINKNAQNMSVTDVKNKMKTLSQGQYSDSVLQKMASTFKTLATLADFSEAPVETPQDEPAPERAALDGGDGEPEGKKPDLEAEGTFARIDGLVYNINIVLPESRDPAVYDALFRSLKEHLR